MRASSGSGRPPARLGIDDGIEPQIEIVEMIMSIRARAVNVAASSAYRASRMPTAKLPGPARAFCRDLARDAKDKQSRRRREPRIALDRETGADQRRCRAAHRGHLRHQRMTVARCDACRPAVGHDVRFAGQADHRVVAFA